MGVVVLGVLVCGLGSLCLGDPGSWGARLWVAPSWALLVWALLVLEVAGEGLSRGLAFLSWGFPSRPQGLTLCRLQIVASTYGYLYLYVDTCIYI